MPDDLGAAFGVGAVFAKQQGTILIGREEARTDCVDAYSLRRPLASEESGEVDDGRLGGGVGDDA